MKKIKAGIVGCGVISDIYLKNLTEVFKNIELIACADLFVEKAKEKCQQYSIPNAYTVDEIMADSDIEMILNLTIPQAHTEINMRALKAGKHVYCEKPLALNREDAHKVLEYSESKGLLVGCAPDTFLGAGIQTCRKIIDDGWIGKPIAATAFMSCHGHESWHAAPEFYYKAGGGPMLDMGPYYLTALVNLIGPVKRVAGMAKKSFNQRTITSEPKYGQIIDVEVDTHVVGLIDFENGAAGTILTSFDIWDANLPRIEIYGTLGSLSVPDPNTFGGPVRLKLYNHDEWKEIPLSHIYEENSRGIGFSDMACAIMESKQHRASGMIAAHVLDIMLSIIDSSNEGSYKDIQFKCQQPEAMKRNFL